MFLAVFIICEVAAKPAMNKEEPPQTELAESKEVEEESQNVPDHHHKEADKSHMNKKERKIQGKKPSSVSASVAKNPPCPKGQSRGKKGACAKGFTG